MENILELEAAIRYCDFKIKHHATTQVGKPRSSEEYKKEDASRLEWVARKHELQSRIEKIILNN